MHLSDVAPHVRAGKRGKVVVQLYNMSIEFQDGLPVAFARGPVRRRLSIAVLDIPEILKRYERGASSEYLMLAPDEFECELYDNIRAAVRRLSDGYDVVAESKHYVDILLKAVEQLDVIVNNDWADPGNIREAAGTVRMFLVERMVGLIKQANENVHVAALRDISAEALHDLIAAGRLTPTSENVCPPAHS